MNQRETNRTNRSSRSANSGEQSDTEFSQAMNRLENAVQDLVSVTAGQLGDRATALIDETSKRLEAELRLKRASEDDPEVEEQVERRHQRRRSRHRFDQRRRRSSRLTINRENEKIAGVCAGLAPYLGVEIWMVRLAAVTGLLFIPHIVFPAYWIAYFVMEKPDKRQIADERDDESRRSRRRRKGRSFNNEDRSQAAAEAPAEQAFNARRDLKYTRTDLTQAELRLRRLESFVTSKQYELQKELHRIERDASAT